MDSVINTTVFCTVITPDYMPFALTLHESLAEWHREARLVVLVTVCREEAPTVDVPDRNGFSVMYADDLHSDPSSEAVYRKYHSTDMDAYRWACKPGLMKHLLREEGVDRVVFCDSDLLFTADYADLLGYLDEYRMVLTPHHLSIDPQVDAKSLRVYKTGFLNGGFVAVNPSAGPILDWWQASCHTACVKESNQGLYVDQRYLDVLPFLFENVKVTRDTRLNVGGWRLDAFLADHPGGWPLPPADAPVFVHFTSIDERVLLPGPSEPVLVDYSERLKRHGLSYDFLGRIKAKRAVEEAEQEELARQRRKLTNKIRARLRLGTRCRHLLEALKAAPRPMVTPR